MATGPGVRPASPAAAGPREPADGFARRAARGLDWLGGALALGPGFGAAVDDAVPLLFDGWGHRRTRGSDPADPAVRTAPFEYSLVLGAGGPRVRIFLRPLPPAGNTTALGSWERGWRTLAALERRGTVATGRAAGLRELFRPVSRYASFGFCLAATIGPDGLSGIKVYLDTLARGPGANRELVGTALERLGHGAAWQWLRTHDPMSVEVPMPAVFSMDLEDSPAARAKFYTTVTERSADALEERMGRLSATARRSTSTLLTALPAAGRRALAAPGIRPTLCWSLTARRPGRPEDATLYLPFNHHTPDGTQALARLGGLLAPAARGRVEAVIAQCATTAPEGGATNPFHWAAAKLDRADGELTLYLAADRVDAAARAES